MHHPVYCLTIENCTWDSHMKDFLSKGSLETITITSENRFLISAVKRNKREMLLKRAKGNRTSGTVQDRDGARMAQITQNYF